jgi:hypothetical protein
MFKDIYMTTQSYWSVINQLVMMHSSLSLHTDGRKSITMISIGWWWHEYHLFSSKWIIECYPIYISESSRIAILIRDWIVICSLVICRPRKSYPWRKFGCIMTIFDCIVRNNVWLGNWRHIEFALIFWWKMSFFVLHR